MKTLPNVHPGEVLLEEFLIPMEISAYKLAKDINIPQSRLSQILNGKRAITADTAVRLSAYFGNSAKFWLGLQNDFDIEEEKKRKEDELKVINQLSQTIKKFSSASLRPSKNYERHEKN
jgi:addiction module HigA family antidote